MSSIRESPHPVSAHERIDLIDVVRGFALFGVLLANLVWITTDVVLTDARLSQLPTAPLDRIVKPLVVFFVDHLIAARCTRRGLSRIDNRIHETRIARMTRIYRRLTRRGLRLKRAAFPSVFSRLSALSASMLLFACVDPRLVDSFLAASIRVS